MSVEEQIENYDRMMYQNHLSKEGLRHYIALLKNDIMDWEEKLNELTTKEALTKSDLKDIEENKAKYGTKNER